MNLRSPSPLLCSFLQKQKREKKTRKKAEERTTTKKTGTYERFVHLIHLHSTTGAAVRSSSTCFIHKNRKTEKPKKKKREKKNGRTKKPLVFDKHAFHVLYKSSTTRHTDSPSLPQRGITEISIHHTHKNLHVAVFLISILGYRVLTTINPP